MSLEMLFLSNSFIFNGHQVAFMGNQSEIEKGILRIWRDYEFAVTGNSKASIRENRHLIGYGLACLLNTYLDNDPKTDWRGAWADNPLDAIFEWPSDNTMIVRGLMVCGRLEKNYMHMTPFVGELVRSPSKESLEEYSLYFAAHGPWGREGAPFALPYTRNKEAQQKLLKSQPQALNDWAHVYRGGLLSLPKN